MNAKAKNPIKRETIVVAPMKGAVENPWRLGQVGMNKK